MKVTLIETSIKKDITTKEFKVPYYSFAGNRQDRAISIILDKEYDQFLKDMANQPNQKKTYEELALACSKFIIQDVRLGFNVNTEIKKYKLSSTSDHNFGQEFPILYRDYDYEITKEQFEEFRTRAIKEITNELTN